jgi:hypothetical protein
LIFDHRHYVPVLKVKRAEKAALRLISPTLKASITPLLEIVERRPDKTPSIGKHLKTSFANLAESVDEYSRCFLDAREIAPDGPSSALEVFRMATASGITFTPITGISRPADIAAALKHRSFGIGLRLTRSEFEAGGLADRLRDFMAKHKLDPGEVDMILDLGAVDSLVIEGISALTREFLLEVPDHAKWRTFTVSGCAFPLSMGGVKANSHQFAERSEWIAWRDGPLRNQRSLSRVPTFSDCAIQHPKGVEGFDPRIMPMSASIRYTLPESWLLIKGKSQRVTPLKEQFPGLARQLARGALRRQFAGKEHCSGCASVRAAAEGASKLGSPAVWRRLGTIHHITVVAEALVALPSS